MGDSFSIQRIFKNPAFGLIPMFVFSFLVSLTDSRMAVGIGLALSLLGHIVVTKQSRLIFTVSVIAFAISLFLSFTIFLPLPLMNRFVVVEIVFVLSLMSMRLSRGKIMSRLVRRKNIMLKNYLKEAFRVAFQTQYGLSMHLLLVLLLLLFNGEGSRFTDGSFIMGTSQVVLLLIILMESWRLYLLNKKLHSEEWLPVVTERGDVTGRVAKSITKDMKNKFMHPVVRVALIYKGTIYLKERDASRLLNPGLLDYPFEKYMQFNDEIDVTIRNSIAKECGGHNIPLRFLLKYTFENETTKRLIFLYVSDIEDEDLFNSLPLSGGKLWTEAQIEDNMGTSIFSECFELEFEYLKNTVLLAHQFRNKLMKA